MATPKNFKDKVHKRLRTRVIMYFVISILILGVSIFHVVKDHASALAVFAGLIAGMAIGVVVSRMYKISWDGAAGQVISKFDAVGILILVAYVLFEISRERIVSHFVGTQSVVAVSFAVLAGVMYGRVVGIRGKIKKVFREENVV